MSAGTSKSLVEALDEADSSSHRKGVIQVARNTNKTEAVALPIIFVQQNVQSGLIQGNTNREGPKPRRALRGNATGLLMSSGVSVNNQVHQTNTAKFTNPTILRPGNRSMMPNVGEQSFRIYGKSPIPVKLINSCVRYEVFETNASLDNAEKMKVDDDTNVKKSVCSECRALVMDPVCDHCGARVIPDPKRLKKDTIINPLVTITKLATVVNTPVIMEKVALTKRCQPLEVVKMNGKCNQTPPRRLSLKKPSLEPPECLTLSSDDETDKTSTCKTDVNYKLEPIDFDELVAKKSNSTVMKREEDELAPADDEQPTVNKPCKHSLGCRSVRIGSYKCRQVLVNITEDYFCITVPTLAKDKGPVTINITFRDIVQILAHFGNSLPLLVIRTSRACSSAIRNRLHMDSTNGPYYDPESSNEILRRIIMLPDKVPEDVRVSLQKFFKERDAIYPQHQTFCEISYKTANDILLKSVPPEIKEQVLNLNKKATTAAARIASKPENKTNSEIMAMYPLPPLPGGISITTGDFRCLNPETCINDAIIDFYLKYLYYEKLSEFDRQRTHVFSSFFYGKLVSSRGSRSKLNLTRSLQSPEEHKKRLKGWTKHVDIFEKDFIIVPINQKNHWYLAVICFPVLAGEVNCALSGTSSDKSSVESASEPDPVNDVSVIKEAPLRLVSYDDDDSNSSAETVKLNHEDFITSQDVEMKDSDENNLENIENVPSADPTKIPCILLFDSLHPRNWSGVVANLREYLNMEWKVKRNTPKSFDKDTIKGAYPIVPQQSNYMDCGIYLLQNVESFFESPIKDFHLPIRGLQDWYKEESIVRKRKDIQELISRLSNEQRPHRINEIKCSSAIEDGPEAVKSVQNDSTKTLAGQLNAKTLENLTSEASSCSPVL